MYKIEEHLENRNGILHIGGCSTQELADEFGTPLYVYDENRIRQNYREVFNAFKKRYAKFKLYYAIKANNNSAILRILETEKSGVDCSSPAEIYLAKKAGFTTDRILYSGVYHSNEELKFAVSEGVPINLEDLSQIDRLAKFGIPEFISFRINPGIGSGKFKELVFAGPDAKFGIIESDVLSAYEKAKNYGVKKFGMHMMTGSCITEPAYFEVITEKLLDIAGNVARELGINFEFIDIGGGLGIPYKPGEQSLDLEETAERVVKKFEQKILEHGLGEPYLVMEPGRYIVGDSGILLTKVHSIKNAHKKFIGVDAGMNTLLRPALYNAYHEIYVANALDRKETEKVNVCGPVCENTDQFAKDRLLPRASEGDLLAILNAGAYGFAMGSQYNTRPRCAEVLVNKGNAELIRSREDFSEFERNVIIPERLKSR